MTRVRGWWLWLLCSFVLLLPLQPDVHAMGRQAPTEMSRSEHEDGQLGSEADEAQLQQGLVGILYKDLEFTRFDERLWVPLVNSDEIRWAPGQGWSLRLQGYIEAQYTGQVSFEAEADDGIRLVVDGSTVIDGWGLEAERSGEMVMVKGKKYPVVLSYYQHGGPSYLRVYWSWPASQRHIIPQEVLWHSTRDAFAINRTCESLTKSADKVIVTASNPSPKALPSLEVWQRGKELLVASTFPNVPAFTCDSWCYESPVDFVGAKVLEGGRVQLRHRSQAYPHVYIVTTVTPEPGAVEFLAKVEIDKSAGGQLPETIFRPNLCWQLRRAYYFASAPSPYPEFIKRCFIFTDKGRTFLDQTDRRKIPCRPADDDRNNPPWVQSYAGVWQEIPEVPPDAWANYSLTQYTTVIMGAVSRDGKFLTAIANDSAGTMCQAWHDCMHNNPEWLPVDAPLDERVWRVKIYVMENNTEVLLARVARDFPKVPALQPVVEVQEQVYRFEEANNGAAPMWCFGSTCLVRIGDDVFASGIETLPDFKPLNNCRWMLYKRDSSGWQQVQVDSVDRTREPCPLACFPDGSLFMSVNPTLTTDPNAYDGPSRPQVLEFAALDPRGPFKTTLPVWDGTPSFTGHSYRSFAADGPGHELILFQNIDYTHAEWSFRDNTGKWVSKGKLKWPWGAEYDKPQPIRVCYPNVALKNRAVHFCGVSDIIEPYEKWRQFKLKAGKKSDYTFRRLFYTWSPDIMTGKFGSWVEVASRDKTCGRIRPGDLWVAPDGAAHLVWTERAIDERLREEFFPDAVQSHAINYAIVREGKVVLRRTLVSAEEAKSKEIPKRPRFQNTPDDRLFVFYYVRGTDDAGKAVSENRLLELYKDGSISPSVQVPLQYPMYSYFTATERAGSPPSKILHLLGQRPQNSINYARIRLYK